MGIILNMRNTLILCFHGNECYIVLILFLPFIILLMLNLTYFLYCITIMRLSGSEQRMRHLNPCLDIPKAFVYIFVRILLEFH